MQHLLIIGDDFTPSVAFREAIEGHPLLQGRELQLSEVNLDGKTYFSGPTDGVREFIGRPDALLPYVADVDVIVTTFAPITRLVLEAAPRLKCIVVGRGGPVNVDVEAAKARGVQVAFAPGRNAEAVAQYVVGLIMAVTRQIVAGDRWVRQGNWKTAQEDTFIKPTGPELKGRTLGIIGMGAIGARVANLIEPFGVTTLSYDPYLSDEQVRARGGTPVGLTALLESSDVITIHARPREGSSPIVGREELSAIKEGAYLINTSRGANLDHEAVLAALREGRLGGVALDVLATEPLSEKSEFLRFDNVVLTPHAAGVSTDVPGHTAAIVAERVAEWLETGTSDFLM